MAHAASRLTLARRLVEEGIDNITIEIAQRRAKYSSLSVRANMTACFGSELAVLHILHKTIMKEQYRGRRKASPELRQSLIEVMKLPKMYVDPEGRVKPLMRALFRFSFEREKFIQLLS